MFSASFSNLPSSFLYSLSSFLILRTIVLSLERNAFSFEPLSNLALRISDEQIAQYQLFFEQKCREQRPYATNDTCMNTAFAFEYQDKWYYVYPKLAPHNGAIEDRNPDWDPEYFTRPEN